MTSLVEHDGFITEGGEGGESTHEANDEEEMDDITVRMMLESHGDKTDQETANNIYYEGFVGKRTTCVVMC